MNGNHRTALFNSFFGFSFSYSFSYGYFAWNKLNNRPI